VLVLPQQIRVRNAAADQSSYHLAVPGTVRLVRVTIRGRSPVEIRPGTLTQGEEHTLPMGSP
jgi:hypothetical protein